MKEISVIKEDDRQKITLIYDTSDNKMYVQRRIHDDKREIYKTLQKINHPNIPKIIDVQFDCDTVVIEEHIDAVPLSRIMESGQPLTKNRIRKIVKQVVSAMIELHKACIIHRDIKPDNILVDEWDRVWLIDYDIARIYREEMRKDTELRGTFGYAPVEQFGMMPTDFKSDIYAFGVTLSRILDFSKVRGSLRRIADKCRRMDPSQRYQNAVQIKREFIKNIISKIIIAGVFVGLLSVSAFIVKDQITHEPGATSGAFEETFPDSTEGASETDSEVLSLIKFVNFPLSEKELEYRSYEFSETADIFAVDETWAHLTFLEDRKTSGTILLGKQSKTKVKANIELKEGVLSLSLKDDNGHTFEKDFEYNVQNTYEVIYPDNRRKNADIICRDLDGDYIDELLIGVNDCSFMVQDGKVFCYFNYSQAWCLKYDEVRGFVLCDGEMFSNNGKFAFVTNDLRAHLPVWAVREDGRLGYKLKGTKIVPFY